MTRRLSANIVTDIICVLLLVALCGLFYWRLLTGNPLNQQSLVEGDFSGQFVSFAHYQATRLAHGEVPLWNPYNNGGHPFVADTQAAVFYPPRLITIAILNVTGGSTPQRMYDALQKELVLHALIASLLMYALIRRLGVGDSTVGALAAGITFAYGGYLTGYPQLQLAVMEAGVWIPLALLGIHEATRHERPRWPWLAVSGIALALSLLAGHPQTSLFFGYLSLAYLAYRTAKQHYFWTAFVVGALIFGLVGAGMAAVQLIPGAEYTRLTARSTLNFDAMGNGFPFYDIIQMIFPGFLSLWSPLYFGIVGLVLAIYAVWHRIETAIFWLAMAGVAFALSLGHNTIVYDLFYNLAPGFSLFRGQERSAYVIAVAASILVGLGAGQFAALTPFTDWRGAGLELKAITHSIALLAFGLAAVLFVNMLTTPGADSKRVGLVTFSLFITFLAILVLTPIARSLRAASLQSGYYTPPYTELKQGDGATWRPFALIALIIFELFSFGRTNPNLESKPPAERLKMPELVQTILNDPGVYRVDGTRAVRENYGTLYGVMDIEGTSPLRLASVDHLLKLPAERAWEALAVRYVPTDRSALGVPSTIVATGNDSQGPVNLHRLEDARPFARLVYRTWIEPDDNAALGIFSDLNYDARNTVILPADPGVALPKDAPEGQAQVSSFAPESITIQTKSPAAAILSVSLVYYPGWQATVDGQPATILRADTALTALVVPAGDHTVQLRYQPPSFAVGALISILTLILVGGFGLAFVILSLRRTNPEPPQQ